MNPKKIKVLIVDDSVFFRELLIRNLRQDTDIEIIGYAVDSFDAHKKIAELKPDVVTLDVEMPRMDGIEFLRRIMPEKPIPVVVVSSLPNRALDALEVGAVDFVSKPYVRSPEDTREFFLELKAKIKIASIARIGYNNPITGGKTTSRSDPDSAAPKHGIAKIPVITKSGTVESKQRHISPDTLLANILPPSEINVKVIAIGASTGGTDAIVEVVRDLPPESPGVVVVQHMPAGFTRMYAERLDKLCRMSVKECEDGDRIIPGRIIIAAGGYHMRLVKDTRGFYVKSEQGPKVSGHCPSVDVLFESVAEAASKGAIGVILTGMGSDGAKGLLKIRQQGGFTIGQDKESCIVYGMPMVSYNIGAVEKQLSLKRINKELIHRFKA